MGVKTLIFSHLVVFGAGVYAGKAIDAGELETYREAHESWYSKLRRKAGVVTLGAVAVAGLAVVVKLSLRSSKRQN
eukprot:scaffold13191_cov178-Amphora_coffeaeformis.AAC.9